MAVKKSKKLKELVLKVKPLEETKLKRTAKPAKVLVKTKIRQSPPPVLEIPKEKLIKPVKLKKPKLVKLLKSKPIEPPAYKTRIKVIGIGGGGSSIVSEIASEVKKATFVVANTDSQALQGATKEAKHFQFGKSITQGFGTGMNPELGERAAENDKEKIKELLKDYNPATASSRSSLRSERAPTDFCILVSCLGGGTGSGASPVFANILKNLGILTLGIFTLPFEFEGGKRAQIAKDSLEKLRQNLNALVIIPNQKIFQIIDNDTSLKEAFSTINKALAESLEGLITLIYSSGLIHVGFATLKTTLAGRGRLAYFNTVETPIPTGQAENLNQTEELVRKVVSNPLFPYSIQGAKEILFNIDGGLNLNISQVEQIGKTISSSIDPRARVAFGITSTPTPKFGVGASKKRGIKITLLANGCKWEGWEKEKEEPKKELKKKSKKKALPKIQPSEITQISTEEPRDYNPPTTSSHSSLRSERAPVKIKLRKNALEVQKAVREEENKILARERKWETPTFLRRQPNLIQEESEE